MSELIQEDMSGMALIKIYAQEENERRAFRQNNQQLPERISTGKTRNTLFPLVEDLRTSATNLLLWGGADCFCALSIGDFGVACMWSVLFSPLHCWFAITAYQRVK